MGIDKNIKNYIERDGSFRHYTAVGMYHVIYLDLQDSTLCANCATQEVDMIKAAYVHWEGDSNYCVGCDKELKSEYGKA